MPTNTISQPVYNAAQAAIQNANSVISGIHNPTSQQQGILGQIGTILGNIHSGLSSYSGGGGSSYQSPASFSPSDLGQYPSYPAYQAPDFSQDQKAFVGNLQTPAPIQTQPQQEVLTPAQKLTAETQQKVLDLMNIKQDSSNDFQNQFQSQVFGPLGRLNELNNQIAQRRQAYLEGSQNLAQQPIPTPIIAKQQQLLQQQGANEIAALSASAQALSGQISLAKQTLDQAVELKYRPLNFAIEYYKTSLDYIKPFLTADEKRQADQKQLQYDLLKNDIVDFKKVQSESAFRAAAAGDTKTANLILNSTNQQELIGVGGKYLTIPTSKVSGEEVPSSFTPTQLNKGAFKSGISLIDFKGLPDDVKNYYVNVPPANLKLFNDDLAAVKNGTLTADEMKSEIDSSPATEDLKNYLKQKVDAISPAVNKPGFLSNIWSGIVNFFQ